MGGGGGTVGGWLRAQTSPQLRQFSGRRSGAATGAADYCRRSHRNFQAIIDLHRSLLSVSVHIYIYPDRCT